MDLSHELLSELVESQWPRLNERALQHKCRHTRLEGGEVSGSQERPQRWRAIGQRGEEQLQEKPRHNKEAVNLETLFRGIVSGSRTSTWQALGLFAQCTGLVWN